MGGEGREFLLVGEGAEEGGDGIALEDLVDEREEFVSDAVAGGDGLGVGGVFAVRELGLLEELVDFGSSDIQDGAKDGEVFHGLLGVHGLEAVGATEEIEKEGFCLVVGVMSEEDVGDAGFLGAVGEEFVAGLSGGGFE